MKSIKNFLCCLVLVPICASILALKERETIADGLTGAWVRQTGDQEQVVLFIDGYHTKTIYNKKGKLFTETLGGPYSVKENKLNLLVEFNTSDKDQTGQLISHVFSIKNDDLTITANGNDLTFKRIDQGTAPLAGLWSITGRMQDGKMTPIHRTGTRKTI